MAVGTSQNLFWILADKRRLLSKVWPVSVAFSAFSPADPMHCPPGWVFLLARIAPLGREAFDRLTRTLANKPRSSLLKIAVEKPGRSLDGCMQTRVTLETHTLMPSTLR
jgi:hypothetical protein